MSCTGTHTFATPLTMLVYSLLRYASRLPATVTAYARSDSELTN